MYLKSAFNYTGSKFQLLEQIYQQFPSKDDVDIFWDIFTGGGSVFINSEYDSIIANDVISPLIEFYKELKYKSWEEIQKKLTPFILDKTDQEAYLQLRELFNQTKDPYQFFSLIQSCTNNMMRFNKKGRFNQTWGKRSYNSNTEKKLLDYWGKIQTLNVNFINKDYMETLPMITGNGLRNFVYLDPPYLITEAGYNAFWSKKLEEQLYSYMDVLDAHGIMFAMSNVAFHKGSNNPHLQKVQKWNIVILEHNYDKVSRKDNDTQEILIKNY